MEKSAPRAIVALALAALAVSCGGDDVTGPVNLTNSGGIGNQMLLVKADIRLDPQPGGFLASLAVEVRDRSDAPVSGADVTVEWNYAPLNLAESESPGVYTAQLSGSASGTLRLAVEKDSMYVRDVALGNIGIHAIVEPQPGDTVPANAPLTVRWVSDAKAPFAVLSTRDDGFDVIDNGEFVVPDTSNPPRLDQHIQLMRYNEVPITGGVRDSYFRMEVRTRSEPVRVLED